MHDYNIIWTGPSGSPDGSMPLGGHSLGCNVWAEDGQLFVYMAQDGAFDENGTLLKAGRLRLFPDGGDRFTVGFRQELRLEEGYITVEEGPAGDRTAWTLWCSDDKAELHILFRSDRPHRFSAVFDCWRYREREVPADERGQCRTYDMGYPGRVVTYPDEVRPGKDSLLFFHRVRPEYSMRNAIIAQQQLSPIADTVPDPLTGLTSGGVLRAGGMHYAGASLHTYMGCDCMGHRFDSEPVCEGSVTVTLHAGQYPSADAWEDALAAQAAMPARHGDTVRRWQDYFARSYIRIDESHPDSPWFAIGRNYQLFRYMLGCNASGRWPTKFNGGLFTYGDPAGGKTPDYRAWSGDGFTAQNQRLLCWPMLKAGDFGAMLPFFEYYRNAAAVNRARMAHFWGEEGAFYAEQANLLGLPTGAEYGWNHSPALDPALEDNPWIMLHWSTALEFVLLILEYARYTGDDIAPYMDFIDSAVTAYFSHYPTDGAGKLRIFPSTALETYKGEAPDPYDIDRYGAENPMDAVAGLRAVLDALLLHLPEGEAREKYRRMRGLCPDLPVGQNAEGLPMFVPAGRYRHLQNCELPQLYRVFPFSPLGLSEEERELGRRTFREPFDGRDQYNSFGWHQNGIFAARLGLYEDARDLLFAKLQDAPRRFPAFWGPGHDWTPDHNHGGSGMILLQEMLMQCRGEEDVEILPTWDRAVDVSFRLYAPGGRVVECECRDGKVTARILPAP